MQSLNESPVQTRYFTFTHIRIMPKNKSQLANDATLQSAINYMSRVPCTKVLSQSTSGFGFFIPFERSRRAR